MEKQKHVTLREVARQAGVSTSTVCRVLHNSGYVSADNREQVDAAVRALGYIPNRVAQGLKRHQTGMIGHILPSTFPNPFIARIAFGLDDEAEKHGFHALGLFTYHDAALESRLVREMAGRMVDGMVFTGATARENVQYAVDLGIPVVMVERAYDIGGIDRVLADNRAGSHLATAHLTARNHRRVAFIGMQTLHLVEEQRFEGYTAALGEAGIERDDGLIRFVEEYRPDCGYEAMRSLMEAGERPTGVFLASDLLAVGALQYLYEKNLRVPQDVSLVGFDNTMAESLAPKLTTVAMPMEEMGRAAVGLLVRRIAKPGLAPQSVTLQPRMQEMESVRSLP